MQIIKLSGNQIDDPAFLAQFIELMSQRETPTIIVHGGGKEITELQAAFDVEPQYIDGLRVSDEFSLKLVKMVLLGAVNPRLVEAFQLAGINAQGLSGIDQGMISAKKLEHPKGDLGRVGDAQYVKTNVMLKLLLEGVIPIVAPICLGADGALNVNADHVAGAIGAAIDAERVIFLTNVPGVLHDDVLIETLTPTLSEQLIADEVIIGGMIPKVHTALALIERGAKQVLITDLEGLTNNTGTTVTAEGDSV